MTATEDFFKKKMAGQTTGSTSGGSATDEFFKKKIAEKSAVTTDANITTPPESTTSPGDLGIKIGEPVKPLISSIKTPSIPDTAYSGQGTTSMGQGVKIDQTPFKMEQQKVQAKNDEDLRIKQEDLVMGAQQMGHLFVDKLSPEDKDILISGLKNKSASLAYKGQADKMSELVGESISPTLTQAGPNDTIDPSLSPDPRNPENFAFYEKQKRNFDMVAPDGTKIKAYNKTAVDDPIENINVALGMGRDQVMGTIGAIGEWMGVSDGTFRKQAENSKKWGELDFNKPLDDTNASIFDSRFWTQKVPQSIPFMVALVPAGIAGAGAGSEVATLAGLGQLGTYLTTAGFAGISSRIAESITEGAGVYAELKDQGVEDKKASQEAFDTAKQNMAMVFSDMGQMAITFAPVKKIPGLQSMLGKVVIPTAKFAFDATSEGGEEVFQGYVQQLNTAQGLGKKPQSILEYLNSDEARETFKLGAATGLMFGGVGVAKDAYDNFIDRAISQVDMVDEAIQNNDIDFVPKMEVLAKKGAVSEQTVEAVKTLIDLSLKNEGTSLSEWMSNGMQARKEKIDETRGKIQDLNNSMKEEVKKPEPAQKEQSTVEEDNKTYYHGTSYDFEVPKSMRELSKSEEGKNVEPANIGGASPFVHLSEDKTIAEGYANARNQQTGKKGVVKEFRVSGKILDATKDPREYTQEEKNKIGEIVKELETLTENRGSDAFIASGLHNISKTYRYEMDMRSPQISFSDIENSKYLPEVLKKYGYSGIKFSDKKIMGGSEDTVAVLPETIKIPEKVKPTELETKPMDLTKGPEVSSTPEKSDNLNIESIKKLSDKEIQEKYTPSEILAIEDKENPTPEETAIHDRYIQAVQAEETIKINKEIESDYAENGQHVAVSEDSDITYRDLEVLAQRITNTLKDQKARFGLKRAKNADISTKTERYLKTSTEATIEALTEEFQSLKNGLKEIADYYAMNKKHPYTQRKLRELHNDLSKGEYDFLEQSDILKTIINPYLYEGKKQVSKNVQKPSGEGKEESSTSSTTDSANNEGESDKTVGTSKTGILNALEEVKKAFPNITIEDISEKGMVVKGDTLPMKEELKKAGGKWNPKYKGWIFPKAKKQIVQDLIDGNTTISDISTQKPVKEKAPVQQGDKMTPTPKEKQKQNTQKLRDIAKKAIEKAEAEIGRDRQENTGRRASMADSARDKARREIEVANMMEKYADMIDSGEEMKFIIESKADMERMMNVFSRALYMQEKEGGDIGKYIPDLFRVRIGTYRREIDSRAPSVWAKATKAGVKDLKNFMYGASDTVNANRYEKEIEYIIKNASELGLNSWTAESMKKQLTDVRAYRKILNVGEDFDWNAPEILEQFQTMKNGTKVEETPEEALKRAERDIVRESNIPGFFPTPEDLVDRMIREASIDIGMRVLEPSAGIGSIADRIRNIGIEPEVGEYNSTLSEHLQKKGYKIVSEDFMELPESEKYDRIIMNPPFENLQDVDHVMKAYNNLQEGGRIVAIMSESPFFRTDKKSTDFRDWLDTVGSSEKLPEGSFKDALKTTGVNTRIVTIDKQKTEAKVEIIEEVPEVVEQTTDTPRFASIDTKIAMNASRGTSFDPERRGLSRISGFKVEMEDIYNELLPYAKTDEQRAILNEEVSSLSEKLATRQNAINSAEGGVVSSMIAGPARFPVARMQKKNEAIHKKNVEYTEFKERAMNSIKKKLKGQAVEEAGGPIEVLKKEIERMKASQEQAKQINAIIRKFKIDEAIRPELEKLGISEKTITDLLTPYMGTRGVQSFSLTSINNKIKEREAKLAKMEKMESLKGTEEATKALYEFEGGKVIDNRAEDRVQILFDEKPTKDQIQELKKRGWRWSPTNSAWQRFRNSGSVQNAREMFPEVVNTPEIKEQGDSNAWIYDVIGAKYGVKPFAQEKIDIQEVYIEAVNLAPEGWTVRIEDPTEANYLTNVSAYADLATKEIVISSTEARKSTAAHEVVHASLSELPEDKRKILIDTARKQWQDASNPELSDEQAEEFLAEEFKYYIESKKWKTKTLFGRLKEWLAKVWNRVKGTFGRDDKIKTFYEDIMNGKIKRFESRVGKKFQSISDKELYDEIDAENFGYKLPPKLGLAYQKYEKEKTPSKVLTSFVEWGRRSFTPLDTAIGNISEKLRERMARFEYGVMNSEIVQQARPVMIQLSEKIKDKRDTDDYRILDIALKNGDIEVVNFYAEKLGISDDLVEVRKILDRIHEEASKLGIDIKYLENYFPRTVNDSVGLLSYLYKTEYGSQIKEAIKLSEIQVGHDLSTDEKAVIANKMLRGYKIAGVTLTPPGNVKARTIEEVTKELNPFYNDSMDSLAIYIQGMNENIEARKLFGKGDNLENSIGAYTMELLANGEITPVQEIQLTKAIQARFANNPMDAWVQAYRGISYLTTMGSVVSALTQIQDLSFSLYENGFMKSGSAWIQAVTGNSKISKEELGIHSIIQEFKEQGKIQGAVTKVFKMVGLEFMDRLGKETFVNAYYKKLQSEAMKGKVTGLEALGDRAQQAMEDLKAGKVTEDIKYILFARLCDFQPLTQSQMPEYYNTTGNMRVLYMLKTYTIKQIDVFRREAFAEIYEGSKMGGDKKRIIKGIKNLVFLVASLAMLGAGTDILKNLLLNRPFSLSDLVIDNMLKIMGFSKYTIYKVKEDSASAGLLSLVVPPFNFFNDVITDIGDVYSGDLNNPMEAQSINNIPVAGKLYYWWFGKGAIKSEKKREKAAKAGMPKVSTKKVSPFSETNGFKTQNGFKDKLYFK